MSELPTSDAVIFRRSVTRLAPYLVFSIAEPHRGESNSESVRREFVLAAAHENGGSLDSCTHCCGVCKDKWGITLAPQEVSAAVQQLVTEGKVTTAGVTRIALTESCSQELAERIRSANEVEALALGEWESKLKQSAPSLGRDQIAELREDLITWIQQIIVERGVEAAVVLYPEQEHYKLRLDEIKALGFSTLPQRDAHVTLMRPEVLQGFLEGMTTIQRRYFDNLMTTAYLMSVFTLEPAALDEVRKLTKGQRLYIDTNVVYALVKLHGRTAYERTVHMLNQSRKVGYEICVTPWTVMEMQRSVEAARHKLGRKESLHATSARTANGGASEGHEVFLEAFRRMQRDAGRITLKDFFALYEQVEELLAAEEVMVVADGCQEIDEDESRIDKQIELLKQARHGDDKPRSVLEHDAKHRLLVEKHRGDGLRRPSNLQCALITNDRGLVRYAAHKRLGELPFAFSFAEWTVRVERLIPRTANYGKTMADIFGSQALYIHGLVSQATIIDAISQIHFQEKYTASLGVRMLMDVPLADDDPDADTEDYERFRNTVSEREASLEAHALGLEEQLAVLRDVIAAESGARTLAEQKVEGLANQHGPVEKPASETRPPDSLTRRDFIRWLAASWIAFAAVLALAVPLGAGWVTGGAALAGDICGSIGLVVGAFWVLRGWRLAGASITLIASLLTIFVSVQAIIE
jgi:hypothetical protein